MGLTNKSTGSLVLENELIIKKNSPEDKIIALGGNPNVGKSTVFNSLTGLNQHTGNWPGKTVTNAQGNYKHRGDNYILVDIPGTYSLMANSVEEEIARDFICFGNPDVTIIVVDATCLERNLNLVLQTLEITSKVVVCVNLMDEAKRKDISINLKDLSNLLGVPVIGTNAIKSKGLDSLMDAVSEVTLNDINKNTININYDSVIEKAICHVENAITPLLSDKLNPRWVALRLIDSDKSLIASIEKYIEFNISENDEIMSIVSEARAFLGYNEIDPDLLRDIIVSNLVSISENICSRVVCFNNKNYNEFDRKIDKYLTSKMFGIPIMIALLGLVFWITITGSNYPSGMLATGLFWIEDRLTELFMWFGSPDWLHGILVLGLYRTLAWVVAVMLPPMAIFFPLFTLLEDLGYLPRVAFNLDNYFKKACACGKQALTMCMEKFMQFSIIDLY